MTIILQSPRHWPPRRKGNVWQLAARLLIAGSALALAGCETMPGDLPPRGQAPGTVVPPAPGAGAPAAAGQPVDQGRQGPPGQAAAALPAAPERTIALLGTRQLRCADPGPQGQNPQQVHSEAFRDATQWRAYLAGIDDRMRAALTSFGVDFNAGESAVLVRPGALPNLGYRISLPQQRLPVTADTLAVQLRVEPPPPHLLQAQVIAFPCVYLRLANADYSRITVDVERLAAP